MKPLQTLLISDEGSQAELKFRGSNKIERPELEPVDAEALLRHKLAQNTKSIKRAEHHIQKAHRTVGKESSVYVANNISEAGEIAATVHFDVVIAAFASTQETDLYLDLLRCYFPDHPKIAIMPHVNAYTGPEISDIVLLPRNFLQADLQAALHHAVDQTPHETYTYGSWTAKFTGASVADVFYTNANGQPRHLPADKFKEYEIEMLGCLIRKEAERAQGKTIAYKDVLQDYAAKHLHPDLSDMTEGHVGTLMFLMSNSLRSLFGRSAEIILLRDAQNRRTKDFELVPDSASDQIGLKI